MERQEQLIQYQSDCLLLPWDEGFYETLLTPPPVPDDVCVAYCVRGGGVLLEPVPLDHLDDYFDSGEYDQVISGHDEGEDYELEVTIEL